MDTWDTDSDEEDTKPTKPTKPQQNVTNWDDSEESDDNEEPKQSKQPQKQNATNWDHSDQSDDGQNQQNDKNDKNDKNTNKEQEDAEKLRKMQKKLQNYNNKKKKKNKRKKKKKQPPPKQQASIPKNQDELIEMSSDSDSSDDNNKKSKKNKPKQKMESYDDRMKTDNALLFEGLNQSKKDKKKDDRVMLSGQVTLKNFPLGSGKDCENLAEQISGLLDQKLFEDAINPNDVFLFYKKLLSAKVIEQLDMVDTKALSTKMNSLLAGKQKAWHTKKNPKGKKKKKPQWIVADKFAANQSRKTGHVDGAYNQDEYSLFD